ncbi:GQ67_02507T0 [Komagataella phaffii]|nr:GQ67_02507T0 [Komagataella phaffii]AOA65399.1 GQ68_02740T0 [Komagataella phaffii GS115]
MLRRFIRTMSESKIKEFTLKTPKGTKDWADKDMVIREGIFSYLSTLFKKHGGVTIDTPVFELREILSGKYGEDSKLIYNLEDQGGELTSLRYDLTVPFARFVAMNGISSIKRYHIAKVYRRDQPAMTKGRMREFYQCDFDVAGAYDTMVPDAEMLEILCSGLQGLGINDFKVKLNHRKILDGIFEVCGVKEEDVRKVSSAVDKLDKSPWEIVRKEMVDEKNQPEEVADRIGEYVKLSGSINEVLEKLQKDEVLLANESASQGIRDMAILSDYVEAFGISKLLSFDLSLARGLDYYTGLIYEAVTAQSAPPTTVDSKKKKSLKEDDDASDYVGVGSIVAGGRYDNLVGMFSASKKSIPCVGVSFGVERIFSLVRQRLVQDQQVRASHTNVFIMAFGNGFLTERMAVAKRLWDAGIETEYLYKNKSNPRRQFEAAEKLGCSIAVILGKDEVAQGKVRVKTLNTGVNDDGELVDLDNVAPYVKEKLEGIVRVDDISRLIGNLTN